jgi:hypothetical protein
MHALQKREKSAKDPHAEAMRNGEILRLQKESGLALL